MEKLSRKEITGIILMIVSVIYFSIFIWWGTTSYHPEFAVGIILVASGFFLSGILTFNSNQKSKD